MALSQVPPSSSLPSFLFLLLLFLLQTSCVPSSSNVDEAVYTSYLDVVPLPSNSLPNITIPLTLDGADATFTYQLGSDPEKTALTVGRPMGNDLSELWEMAGEIKRLAQVHFKSVIEDEPKGNYDILAGLVVCTASQNQSNFINAFFHASLLSKKSTSTFGDVVVKLYNYSYQEHFTPQHIRKMAAGVEDAFERMFSATPGSALALGKQILQIQGITEIGYHVLCPGESPSVALLVDVISRHPASPCKRSVMSILDNLDLLQQSDFEQSFIFRDFYASNRDKDERLPSNLRLTKRDRGILNPINPTREGEASASRAPRSDSGREGGGTEEAGTYMLQSRPFVVDRLVSIVQRSSSSLTL